jgi:hypothetical protein
VNVSVRDPVPYNNLRGEAHAASARSPVSIPAKLPHPQHILSIGNPPRHPIPVREHTEAIHIRGSNMFLRPDPGGKERPGVPVTTFASSLCRSRRKCLPAGSGPAYDPEIRSCRKKHHNDGTRASPGEPHARRGATHRQPYLSPPHVSSRFRMSDYIFLRLV